MRKPFEDSKITIYETEDGQTRLQVKIEGETVWLTQDQMSESFEKSKIHHQWSHKKYFLKKKNL
jgi:hypothetical protein